jgi:hypothetical protein
MATRKVMRSVLRGFLGTYTSRYSDYRGYWLHGQLPPDLLECTVDLLGSAPLPHGPAEAARRLAVRRFAEQLHKSGLARDVVREAALHIARTAEVVEGRQGDFVVPGHIVRFSARSVMDNGRVYQDECKVFVAPHDPDKEGRRLEADWGT